MAIKDTDTDLLKTLQDTLLKYSEGMFRWVQIWLDICLPVHNKQQTIRTHTTATKLLKQLQYDVTHQSPSYQLLTSGYRRLWNFNLLYDYQDERIRLFHIVLAAIEPMTLENLRDALRIQGETYDSEYPRTVGVLRMCSNFLYEDGVKNSATHGKLPLRFVHESARKFITNMSVK